MRQKSSLVKFSGTWLVRFVSSASKAIAASLLPIVAITALAKVNGINLIIGLIAVFTAAFAAGLVFLSPTSSRLDIFAATATYELLQCLNTSRMKLIAFQIFSCYGGFRAGPDWSALESALGNFGLVQNPQYTSL